MQGNGKLFNKQQTVRSVRSGLEILDFGTRAGVCTMLADKTSKYAVSSSDRVMSAAVS